MPARLLRLFEICIAFAAVCLVPVPSASAQSAPSSDLQVLVDVPTPAVSSDPPPSDSSALAEKLQNPIADLISVPFQNNTNFNVGPHAGIQGILNIQPVEFWEANSLRQNFPSGLPAASVRKITIGPTTSLQGSEKAGFRRARP
jgi:hypothetical protein